MEIEYGFLARAAEISPDGTLSVLGAGFDTVRSPAYPRAFPITLVVRVINLGPVKPDLLVDFDIADTAGNSILDAPVSKKLTNPMVLSSKTTVAPNESANLVLSLPALLIPAPGDYQVNLKLTDKTTVEKTIRLHAEVVNG